MSPDPFALRFGIELKFLVKPKSNLMILNMGKKFDHEIKFSSTDEKGKETNRAALRQALVDILEVAKIETGIDPVVVDKWTVADDKALDEQPGFWRCEFVSRVLNTREDWQQEVDQFFFVLLGHCEIQLTTGCAMRVHVSPFPAGKFNVDQLKKIIKQVIYYDSPLTTIMPPERKNTEWALSNVAETKDWKAGWDQVAEKTWAPLFNSFDKHDTEEKLLRGWYQQRYVSWNFADALSGGGTIEFRRPPGVGTADKANHWIAVTLGYVAHAMELQKWSEVGLTKKYPSTEDLRTAISSGVLKLGPKSHGALGSMADVKESATPVTSKELAKINMKKQDKLHKKSVFVLKISSRPSAPTGHPPSKAPQEGKTPLPGNKTTPSGGKTTTTRAKTTPSGGKTTPSGTKTTPSGGKTTPSGGKTTPSGGKTTPSGGKAPVPAGKAGAKIAPSGGKSLPPADKSASHAHAPPGGSPLPNHSRPKA